MFAFTQIHLLAQINHDTGFHWENITRKKKRSPLWEDLKDHVFPFITKESTLSKIRIKNKRIPLCTLTCKPTFISVLRAEAKIFTFCMQNIPYPTLRFKTLYFRERCHLKGVLLHRFQTAFFPIQITKLLLLHHAKITRWIISKKK